MNKILILLIGGALGALLRYLVASSIPTTAFPWPVLIVNAIGCYFIGLLWHASQVRHFSSDMKIFIFIGLFGAFTTFSTYALETFDLLRIGRPLHAVLNFILNNFIGFLMVLAGFITTKAIVFMSRAINNFLIQQKIMK
jgi:CrcB protein